MPNTSFVAGLALDAACAASRNALIKSSEGNVKMELLGPSLLNPCLKLSVEQSRVVAQDV